MSENKLPSIPLVDEKWTRQERIKAREKYRVDLRNAVRELIRINDLDTKAIVNIIKDEMEKEAAKSIEKYISTLPSFKEMVDKRVKDYVAQCLGTLDMKLFVMAIFREQVAAKTNEYLDKNLKITVNPETW